MLSSFHRSSASCWMRLMMMDLQVSTFFYCTIFFLLFFSFWMAEHGKTEFQSVLIAFALSNEYLNSSSSLCWIFFCVECWIFKLQQSSRNHETFFHSWKQHVDEVNKRRDEQNPVNTNAKDKYLNKITENSRSRSVLSGMSTTFSSSRCLARMKIARKWNHVGSNPEHKSAKISSRKTSQLLTFHISLVIYSWYHVDNHGELDDNVELKLSMQELKIFHRQH